MTAVAMTVAASSGAGTEFECGMVLRQSRHVDLTYGDMVPGQRVRSLSFHPQHLEAIPGQVLVIGPSWRNDWTGISWHSRGGPVRVVAFGPHGREKWAEDLGDSFELREDILPASVGPGGGICFVAWQGETQVLASRDSHGAIRWTQSVGGTSPFEEVENVEMLSGGWVVTLVRSRGKVRVQARESVSGRLVWTATMTSSDSSYDLERRIVYGNDRYVAVASQVRTPDSVPAAIMEIHRYSRVGDLVATLTVTGQRLAPGLAVPIDGSFLAVLDDADGDTRAQSISLLDDTGVVQWTAEFPETRARGSRIRRLLAGDAGAVRVLLEDGRLVNVDRLGRRTAVWRLGRHDPELLAIQGGRVWTFDTSGGPLTAWEPDSGCVPTR